MRKLHLTALLLLCILLSGCDWLDGEYASVTPHRQHNIGAAAEEVRISNYLQLRTALEEMVGSGIENRVLIVDTFTQEQLDRSLEMAMRYIKTAFPVGAYAVDEITCETGTSGGIPAVAVNISYLHSRGELLRIQTAQNMEIVTELIADALNRYDTTLVILAENYEVLDISQCISDYAEDHPGLVMEIPLVLTQTYPNTGDKRIIEIHLNYQTSRDDLRSMQEQVERIFDSSSLYVTQSASQSLKFTQLYTFLMERFDYQLKTSITPTYSLLNHGVGDSRSFAVVYAEMCERAGLECHVVVGSRNGEPHCWNMVLDGGYYYHVDLLACLENGGFTEMTDSQMTAYVWDYSAYPACTGAPPTTSETTDIPPETIPSEDTSEPNE